MLSEWQACLVCGIRRLEPRPDECIKWRHSLTKKVRKAVAQVFQVVVHQLRGSHYFESLTWFWGVAGRPCVSKSFIGELLRPGDKLTEFIEIMRPENRQATFYFR